MFLFVPAPLAQPEIHSYNVENFRPPLQQDLILVILRLAAPIANVVKLTTKPFVHALKHILVLRPIVALNALSTANAHLIKPVSIKNVRIHVPILVALMHNVLSEITVQFVLVRQTLQVIHSLDAIAFPLCLMNR